MNTFYNFSVSLLKISTAIFKKNSIVTSCLYITILILIGSSLIMFSDIFSFSRNAYSQVRTEAQNSSSNHQKTLFTLKPTEIPLLKPLSEYQLRIDALNERASRLDEREEILRLLEKEIEEKLTSLQVIRKEIMELLQEKDNFYEKRYEHLVRVYEGMRPEEAAALVEHLHQDTAVQLLLRMKSKKVSQILEAVKPAEAAKLSELLANISRQTAQRNLP